jgi:hypothetical protein
MISLFLGLTLANLICLCTAAGLGYLHGAGHATGQWHVVVGALAAITCCAVHCVILTYFIATAKWVQHAIAAKGLDPALANPTRSFKAQAFPAALAAIAMVFVTAVLGAAADNSYVRPIYHHLVALAMIATNVLTAVAEYGAIRSNGLLIDRILELANARAAAVRRSSSIATNSAA